MQPTRVGVNLFGFEIRIYEFDNGFGASVYKDPEGTFELMLKHNGINRTEKVKYPMPEMTEAEVQAELRNIAAR